MLEFRQLPLPKRLVIFACGLLTMVGIADAVYNLPVITGCAFYGNCQQESFRDPPGELGRDIPN